MAVNRIDSGALPQDLAYRAGMNFTTENMDRRYVSGTLTFTTGQLRCCAAPIVEGDTINALTCFSSVAGTAVTLFKLAVYDRMFNLVASTADIKANLATNGFVSGVVSTPWTSTYSGIVYLGALCTFSTTSPTLSGVALTFNGNDIPVSGVKNMIWLQAGQSDLPAVGVPANSGSIPYILAT